MRIPLRLAAVVTAAVSSVCIAHAQTEPFRAEMRPSQINTGKHANPWNAPAEVFNTLIHSSGADSLRMHFADSALPGGSHIEITSMDDGAIMILDATGLQTWYDTSAYFNGDTLYVRLVAGPNTEGVFFTTTEIEAGLPPLQPQETICGPTDDRKRSFDPRNARLLNIGCTAWLINGTNSFVSAGHCCGSANVCQFNVPLSSNTGSIRHPPPQDQYSVDQSSRVSQNQGPSSDWCVFTTFANSTTGLHAGVVQGAFYNLANYRVANGTRIRITGYGTTSPANNLNQVQKTQTGPLTSNNGTSYCYRTDTSGGNSGSPIVDDRTGQAVGVHGYGGCSVSGGCNSGTSTINSAFWNAIQPHIQGQVTATISQFGSGCVGSNGQTPTLGAIGRPLLGQSFTVTLSGGLPNSFAILFRATSNQSFHNFPLPFPLEAAAPCVLYVAPENGFDFAIDGAGNATAVLNVPNSVSMLGNQRHYQWRVFDLRANPAGSTFSDAATATYGNQ